MARYALQDMIKIRTMREERAGKDLVVARRDRDKAVQVVDERKKILAEFQRTKDEKRDRLFATVIMKIVKREQLDRIKEELAKIDEEEMLLAEAVASAERDLADKETATEKARARFAEESKNLIKIQSHKSAWEVEEHKEEERQQDAEMEEFTGKRNSNDDFDDFE